MTETIEAELFNKKSLRGFTEEDSDLGGGGGERETALDCL